MPPALQFLVLTFAGWVNRHQDDLIAYLRWYRRLIAQTYDGSARRGRGRPMTRRDVAARVVRMAVENPQWGYTRIRGALSNLGHEIARTTVKRIP